MDSDYYPNILQNAEVVKKTGKCLKSIHRHHYVSDPESGAMVDGGLNYLRRGGALGLCEPASLTSEFSYDHIASKLMVIVDRKKGKNIPADDASVVWKRAIDCTPTELTKALKYLKADFPRNSGGYLVHLTYSVIHYVSLHKKTVTDATAARNTKSV